jgi:nucleotide-binding universal stress UspA family protein
MKILIGYDGSAHADVAIDDLNRAGLPDAAEAIVLSAVEWPVMQAVRSWGMVETDFSPEWMERIAAAKQLAEEGASRVRQYFPLWKIEIEPSGGNPADTLLEKATAWPADLIVVGTHGRSAIGRAILGSVSLKLIREAPCSVRVARTHTHDGPLRILIGTDGSPEADTTVSEVCRRSWPTGTEVQVLGVHELLIPANAERIAIGQEIYRQTNEDEHLRLQDVTRRAAEKLMQAGLHATAAVKEGEPKALLIQGAQSWHANTIFVGARGIGRIEGLLLGSVSSATVAHAPCTVEVVR